MKKINFYLILFYLAICSYLHAQQPAFITDSLENYIERGMKDWNIPGLAISIVKDGKTVWMKGYGVRDLESKQPVDENTLFIIASNSKLFTATALTQLEYNKKLSLDDKIIKYFPDFKLYDPVTTSLVNIKDMLSHHLGTKTFQGDFTFWNSNLSRKQIMNKMRLLKPDAQFRQSFGYCNSCFLTAGEIIPIVSGKPWEVYVYDSILMPLSMHNTFMLTQGISERENVAKPYTNLFTGKLTELPYDHVDNLGPAGSMVSCVKDISNWLKLQLDSGRFEGKRILPWEVVQKTRDMQTIISSRKAGRFPTHFRGYGLGIFEADYNGRQVFWHTGGAFGFVSNTCFVPEENLGITILTNNDNQNFFEALRYQILDAYVGVNYINRSAQQMPEFQKDFQQNLKEVESFKARIKNNHPTLPLQSYTGTYKNDLYGPIDISAENNQLHIKFKGHSKLTAKLQYMDHDEWLLSFSNIAYGIVPAKFTIKDNKVISVDIKPTDFVEYDSYHFIKE